MHNLGTLLDLWDVDDIDSIWIKMMVRGNTPLGQNVEILKLLECVTIRKCYTTPISVIESFQLV